MSRPISAKTAVNGQRLENSWLVHPNQKQLAARWSISEATLER